MEKIDLTRAITHENYGSAEAGLHKLNNKIKKVILEEPKPFSLEQIKKGGVLNYATDKFITLPDVSHILPLIIGLLGLLGVMLVFFANDFIWDTEGVIFVSICVFLIIISVIYYFTKPPKETILNRLDGLVTIPGALYQPNITMPFKTLIFVFSTGGEDGLGAFKLEAIRPNNYTFAMFNGGYGCYHDISFYTWYMDKNRPLPPGEAFDAYREQDFERRKAEGFPKPLYPSNVPTPEATPEQQAERDQHWDEQFIEINGKLEKYVMYSEDE